MSTPLTPGNSNSLDVCQRVGHSALTILLVPQTQVVPTEVVRRRGEEVTESLCITEETERSSPDDLPINMTLIIIYNDA